MKSLVITFLALFTATVLAGAQSSPLNLPSGTGFARHVPYVKEAHKRQKLDITYLTPNAPPILILHGDADNVIDISQSQLFCDAMKKARTPG